ncbi:hypothetical protein NQ317_008890 [Molorchus minor]|uniref:Uncharacterized protein n=1 Tax=Molorchus minor TaxID=1323400 RepID=A0ABQ9JLZ4_9CUCU|nr:hypothetical protein NQ317_008890 [Molorchus minor]
MDISYFHFVSKDNSLLYRCRRLYKASNRSIRRGQYFRELNKCLLGFQQKQSKTNESKTLPRFKLHTTTEDVCHQLENL